MENTEQPQTEATEPSSVNLNDLQKLLQIVDVASSRGAFRGSELSQVGAVYDKVNGLLNFVAEQQEKEQEEQPEGPKGG